MDEMEQNTHKISSTCAIPFEFAQNEMNLSHVYYCEIAVQELCYNYKANFFFNLG